MENCVPLQVALEKGYTIAASAAKVFNDVPPNVLRVRFTVPAGETLYFRFNGDTGESIDPSYHQYPPGVHDLEVFNSPQIKDQWVAKSDLGSVFRFTWFIEQ